MRPLALIGVLALLAACGADGAPERPGAAPGLTVTGGAEIGVTGGRR